MVDVIEELDQLLEELELRTGESVGPGVESVGIELYVAATLSARWDKAVWDGIEWDSAGWEPIECDVVEADYQSGASQEAGVLSVADAGALDLRTFDPNRLLDPLATGSPYFGSVRPGTPVRIVGKVPGVVPAWSGFIDEVRFELATSTGRIRAVDGIASLAQSELPEGTVLPNTLRARVRAIVAAVGLDELVPVQAEAATDPPPDPAVAPFDGKATAAWSAILDAALDALVFVWLDPTGTLRFTEWGSLPDAAYSVGCDDGTGGTWLVGLATLESIAQAEAVRNVVRSWSATDVFGAPIADAPSVAKYGERRLDAARIVPNAAVWAQHILDDRADAGLEVTLGELRPYSADELATLLAAAMTGPSVVRVRDDSHGELVDLDVALLGAAVGITPTGWRFRSVTMIPRAEWDEEAPPVVPPIPPEGTYHQETRSYVATSDALLALTSGGSKYGAGAATTLPVGAWSGWQYRSLVQLPAIDWTKVRRIVSATLILTTSDQVRIGFGSSPTIEVKRITGSWSAGSASSPSGSNAVVWPGPAVTGSVFANVTKSENAGARIRVDGLVLPWAPSSIGGSGAAQRGLALYPGSGSGADTSEFWPVEKGGSSRPSLELVLEVFD